MMVTHDPVVAAGQADEVVFLADGRVVDHMAAPTPSGCSTASRRWGCRMWRYTHRPAGRQGGCCSPPWRSRSVCAVSGTLVITDSAGAAADAAFAEATPRVEVVVRATPRGEGEVFSDITGELFAQPMPAAAVDRVACLDGVAAAIGVVSGDAQLLGRDGHVAGGGRARRGSLRRRLLHRDLRAGRVLAHAGEVVIDRATAQQQRFGVGDQIRVLVSGEPRHATVVGILDAGRSPPRSCWSGSTRPPPGSYSPRPRPGRLSRGPGAAGVSQRELRDRVAAALGPGYQAFTSGELAAERPATPARARAATARSCSSPAWSRCSSACLIRNTFTIVGLPDQELALLRCRRQPRSAAPLGAAAGRAGGRARLPGRPAGRRCAGIWVGALLASVDEAVVDVTGPTASCPAP